MEKIVLNAERLAKLNSHEYMFSVYDQHGNVAGYLLPDGWHSIEEVGPELTEEELDRREAKGPGRPLREFLAEMEQKLGHPL